MNTYSMKAKKLNFISIIVFVILTCEIVFAQTPRNIKIEVEFREIANKNSALIGIDYASSRTSKTSRQFIMVSDGLSASIRIGQDVPYISFYLNGIDCGT